MESEDEAQREHTMAREAAKKKEAEVKTVQIGRQNLHKVNDQRPCRLCCVVL